MFSKWLNNYFRATGPTNIDPIHSPSVVLDAQDRVVTSAHPNIIGKISADKIRVDAPITESITSTKVDTDQEYINEMTTRLRRLNEMLANCPTGVTIRIETRDQQVFINGRPAYKIVGTVGKTL